MNADAMTCPNPSRHCTRYRFVGSSADGRTYYWESVLSTTGDSRVEQITCGRAFFWSQSTDV